MMDERPRYTTSVAAELIGMHPQTLRMYETRGLLRPGRTPGGTRRYSEADLVRLRRIGELTTELGLNLSGAARVLEMEERISALTAKVAALESQLDEAARTMRREIEQVHRSYRRELIPYTRPGTPMRRWTSQN
jgi:MerR family transcriptional regulator, heat shock protein HspR